LVASPRQSGSRPVANGSSVPVCPGLQRLEQPLGLLQAAFEVRPAGLSSNRTPSTLRRIVLVVMVALVVLDRLFDQLAEMHASLDGFVVMKSQLAARCACDMRCASSLRRKPAACPRALAISEILAEQGEPDLGVLQIELTSTA
jgi:hypothetical protein